MYIFNPNKKDNDVKFERSKEERMMIGIILCFVFLPLGLLYFFFTSKRKKEVFIVSTICIFIFSFAIYNAIYKVDHNVEYNSIKDENIIESNYYDKAYLFARNFNNISSENKITDLSGFDVKNGTYCNKDFGNVDYISFHIYHGSINGSLIEIIHYVDKKDKLIIYLVDNDGIKIDVLINSLKVLNIYNKKEVNKIIREEEGSFEFERFNGYIKDDKLMLEINLDKEFGKKKRKV